MRSETVHLHASDDQTVVVQAGDAQKPQNPKTPRAFFKQIYVQRLTRAAGARALSGFGPAVGDFGGLAGAFPDFAPVLAVDGRSGGECWKVIFFVTVISSLVNDGIIFKNICLRSGRVAPSPAACWTVRVRLRPSRPPLPSLGRGQLRTASEISGLQVHAACDFKSLL